MNLTRLDELALAPLIDKNYFTPGTSETIKDRIRKVHNKWSHDRPVTITYIQEDLNTDTYYTLQTQTYIKHDPIDPLSQSCPQPTYIDTYNKHAEKFAKIERQFYISTPFNKLMMVKLLNEGKHELSKLTIDRTLCHLNKSQIYSIELIRKQTIKRMQSH